MKETPWASLRLRSERNLERIRALLDLSSASLGLMYGSLLLILGTGIWAGFRGRWWDMGWIWPGLGLLIFIILTMNALASPYYIGPLDGCSPGILIAGFYSEGEKGFIDVHAAVADISLLVVVLIVTPLSFLARFR